MVSFIESVLVLVSYRANVTKSQSRGCYELRCSKPALKATNLVVYLDPPWPAADLCMPLLAVDLDLAGLVDNLVPPQMVASCLLHFVIRQERK